MSHLKTYFLEESIHVYYCYNYFASQGMINLPEGKMIGKVPLMTMENKLQKRFLLLVISAC